MIPFNSHSQCGQDRFVNAVLGGKRDGVFADIGMSHPVKNNNTVAFEDVGWAGFMIDADLGCEDALRDNPRTGQFIRGDSTKLDWAPLVSKFGARFDYLSLDVDSASLGSLRAIPLGSVSFGVITIEHDSYRFGPNPRKEMRLILKAAKYLLVCADVISAGCEFEDWWVHESVPVVGWASFICDRTPWEKIMERIP